MVAIEAFLCPQPVLAMAGKILAYYSALPTYLCWYAYLLHYNLSIVGEELHVVFFCGE